MDGQELPKDVLTAVEGFTAALTVVVELRRQANAALQEKYAANQAKKEYQGSDNGIAKALATRSSAANKAYTATLDKFKGLKTAASIKLMSVDDALKNADKGIEPQSFASQKSGQETLPETIPRLSTDFASSPLSSPPASPRSSTGQPLPSGAISLDNKVSGTGGDDLEPGASGSMDADCPKPNSLLLNGGSMDVDDPESNLYADRFPASQPAATTVYASPPWNSATFAHGLSNHAFPAPSFSSHHFHIDDQGYPISIIPKSGHFNKAFMPMNASLAMPLLVHPANNQLETQVALPVPMPQEAPASNIPPLGTNETEGSAKKTQGRKVRKKGKEKEPTLADLQSSVSGGDGPKVEFAESPVFAVLPKPGDPIYTPPLSRHDIPGFDPLDIHKVSYRECDHIDPAYEPTTTKDLMQFTSLPDFTKSKLAREARNDFDHFARPINAMPISPKLRDMVRNEAAFLPTAMLHSRRTALHVHTTNARNMLCTYHKFSKKADLHTWDGASPGVRKGFSVTGVPYPRAVSGKLSDSITPRQPGHLHCGCPEDIVLMEAILRKTTLITSVQSGATETWQHTYMDPRTRMLTMTAFMDWTGLTPSDFFREAPDGHLRANPYAELLDRQISVLQQRRQALGSHSSNSSKSRNSAHPDPTQSVAPPHRHQSVAETLNQLDDPASAGLNEIIFSDAE